HEPASDGGAADALLATAASECEEAQMEWLERENERWAFLGEPDPVASPARPVSDDADVRRLHQELRFLVEQRQRWDEVVGHLAMIFIHLKGWYWLGFASFQQYCEERLGMCVRAVEHRAALGRKPYQLPPPPAP